MTAVTDADSFSCEIANSAELARKGTGELAAGNLPGAQACLEQAIAKATRAYGADSPHLAALEDNLAEILARQERWQDAERIWAEALEKLEKAYYKDHFSLVPLLDHLGACLLRQNRLEDALPVLERSVEIRQKTQIMDHPDYLQSILSLAKTLQQAGQAAKAEPLLAKALKEMGKYHWRQVGDFYQVQAAVLADQGKSTQADAAFQSALNAFKQQRSYSQLAECLQEYAVFLKNNGREDEADLADRQAKTLSGSGGR